MNIYEINEAILQCVDPETGEVDDHALIALQIMRDAKIENVALWIKNLKSDISDLKVEEKTLAERRRRKENKVERLRKYLEFALAGQRFETPKCVVSFRKSHKVEVSDLWTVPEDFLRYNEPTVDKKAVAEAIKNGETVNGCELVESISMTIK